MKNIPIAICLYLVILATTFGSLGFIQSNKNASILHEVTLRLSEVEAEFKKIKSDNLKELTDRASSESDLDLPLPEQGSILNGYENILIPAGILGK